MGSGTTVPREYPIVEVAISLFTKGIGTAERAQEGDIIVIRRPVGAIGFAEAKLWLWFLVDGLEWDFLDVARDLKEPFDPDDDYGGPGFTTFDMRRYSIPLHRLQAQFAGLNLARLRDPADAYQPFYAWDEETTFQLTARKPLQIEGLIFDKVIGDYL